MYPVPSPFPLILLFCLIGVYSLNYNIWEIIIMIIFGVVGYLMRKFEYEPAPFVFALSSGPDHGKCPETIAAHVGGKLWHLLYQADFHCADGYGAHSFFPPRVAIFKAQEIFGQSVDFFWVSKEERKEEGRWKRERSGLFTWRLLLFS